MMKYKELLIEFDLQKTIQNYSEKLLNRAKVDISNTAQKLLVYARSGDTTKSIEEIINLFISNDPTSKKAYVLWMINAYLANGIRFLEDLGRTNEALITYIDLKFRNILKPEHKDINKIKSLNELEGLIDEYKEKPIIAQSERQREKELEDQFFKSGEAELFYNDNEIKVVIPKTEKASCFFGRNTKWCTAAINNNMFKEYYSQGPLYRSSHGFLYIILLKKENKRYQFHFETSQFMNEKDQDILKEEWDWIRKKYPKLIEKFDNLGRKYHFPPLMVNHTDKDIINSIKHNAYNIIYFSNISEELQIEIAKNNPVAFEYIQNPEKTSQKALGIAIEKINYPHMILKHHNYELSLENQLKVVRNQPRAIEYLINPRIEVKIEAIKNNPRALILIKPWTFELIKTAIDAAIEQNDMPIIKGLVMAGREDGQRYSKSFYGKSLENLNDKLIMQIKKYLIDLGYKNFYDD